MQCRCQFPLLSYNIPIRGLLPQTRYKKQQSPQIITLQVTNPDHHLTGDKFQDHCIATNKRAAPSSYDSDSAAPRHYFKTNKSDYCIYPDKYQGRPVTEAYTDLQPPHIIHYLKENHFQIIILQKDRSDYLPHKIKPCYLHKKRSLCFVFKQPTSLPLNITGISQKRTAPYQ